MICCCRCRRLVVASSAHPRLGICGYRNSQPESSPLERLLAWPCIFCPWISSYNVGFPHSQARDPAVDRLQRPAFACRDLFRLRPRHHTHRLQKPSRRWTVWSDTACINIIPRAGTDSLVSFSFVLLPSYLQPNVVVLTVSVFVSLLFPPQGERERQRPSPGLPLVAPTSLTLILLCW